MDVKAQDLRYLVEAARAGTLTRAAQELGVTTSTLSRRLARLEDELGLSLLERGRSGVRPTSGGQRVLADAQRVLFELETVSRTGKSYGQAETGDVRIGIMNPLPSEHLTAVLTDWHSRYPAVVVTVSEIQHDAVAGMLRDRTIHVVCSMRQNIPVYAESVVFDREQLGLALPRSHPLADKSIIDSVDLELETLLVPQWAQCLPFVRDLTQQLGSQQPRRSGSDTDRVALMLAAAGYGLAIATASMAGTGDRGAVFRPLAASDASVEIALAWSPEIEEPAVGRFLAFVRDRVRSLER